MVAAHGLPDLNKALRVVLDYGLEDCDPAVVYGVSSGSFKLSQAADGAACPH